MKWLKFAPFLGLLALVAGIFGYLFPASRGLALTGVLGFGLAALVGWIETARRFEQSVATMNRQVSEIEALESEVVRHRDALDDLAEGLDAQIFLVDNNLRLLYANSKADEFFDTDDREGDLLRAITLSAELDELTQNVLKNRIAATKEITLHHPRERTFQAQCWPEEYGQDRLFLSLRDITDLRHLETVRRDFVANVSHELRTPMTTIRAMAETLEEGDDDPTLQQRYLNKIIREVDRLTHITDDLLTLSIAESGTVQAVSCDFSELVGSVITQLEKKALEKGLKLTCTRPKNLPISANETQLTQIIFNLVDNALNYTSEGHVEVHLTTDEKVATFKVKDSGIGISSEHLPRIFERFYRVDKGRSRASGGTGLGLAIVKHLVELHGGEIIVESQLNRGTEFTVRLPLPKADSHLPL